MSIENTGAFEETEVEKHENAIVIKYMQMISKSNILHSARDMQIIEQAYREGFRKGQDGK